MVGKAKDISSNPNLLVKVLRRARQASDPVPFLSCVPPRSVLGPAPFLVFINDSPNNIKFSDRLFADDCVLNRNINLPKDCQILQK